MKSSPSIWHYVVSVKSKVKISQILVAFLENTNFKDHFMYHIILKFAKKQIQISIGWVIFCKKVDFTMIWSLVMSKSMPVLLQHIDLDYK